MWQLHPVWLVVFSKRGGYEWGTYFGCRVVMGSGRRWRWWQLTVGSGGDGGGRVRSDVSW